ncbi:bifunctional 3'-5' exonuclease/DNA polymerase [Sanguibacter sp. A247]|uniref:bifunctional 3'-5' exonuclease/DNA polymerase n=1 Tax=unclassified Sanguibacter TaxID=2645534 RepID=UPI003FD75824
MYVVVVPGPEGRTALTTVSADGPPRILRTVDNDALPASVVELERTLHPRWTWADTEHAYPPLLAAGVRVDRCHDLRLSRAILRHSLWTAGSVLAREQAGPWDEPRSPAPAPTQAATAEPLFDLGSPRTALDPVVELRSQLAALRSAGRNAARLGTLLAAESAGALVAAEMHAAGLPWRADVHDQILARELGARVPDGYRPALMEAKAIEVREALGVGPVNPDSPVDLLAALRRAGLPVRSTSKWELRDVEHPVVAPLLEYKSMARLFTANGWAWLDTWVRGGRFRPVYVVGGVVTGRWASDGGGALQLPHVVRDAVQADDGWRLVVADAAQLEPRVLAAMSGDHAMAQAGRAADMYEGIVASGAVPDRSHAKFGMLGAMYGGTQGVSGQVLPQLRRAFPDAIGLVERAAEAGERGEQVMTWLGRTSPLPTPAATPLGGAWGRPTVAGGPVDGTAARGPGAGSPGAGPVGANADGEGGGEGPSEGSAEARTAERAERSSASAEVTRARAWGRFTRNFVVQGTAAEWAMCWMAVLRQRLHALALAEATDAADPSAGVPGATAGPHLVFFLHDEVVVHTPEHLADEVARIVEESAIEAGRILFGPAGADGVEFRLTTAVVTSYAAAAH